MRRTRKLKAADRLLRTLPGRPPKHRTHEEVYNHLERKGYWWNAKAGQWEDTPKPSTSMFKNDMSESSGVFRIRIMGHPDDLERAIEKTIRGLTIECVDVIEQSQRYDNRRGIGQRVYLTCQFMEQKS